MRRIDIPSQLSIDDATGDSKRLTPIEVGLFRGLHDAGPDWVAGHVLRDTLAQLGVTGDRKTINQALRRAALRGFVESRQAGRDADWRLTDDTTVADARSMSSDTLGDSPLLATEMTTQPATLADGPATELDTAMATLAGKPATGMATVTTSDYPGETLGDLVDRFGRLVAHFEGLIERLETPVARPRTLPGKKQTARPSGPSMPSSRAGKLQRISDIVRAMEPDPDGWVPAVAVRDKSGISRRHWTRWLRPLLDAGDIEYHYAYRGDTHPRMRLR